MEDRVTVHSADATELSLHIAGIGSRSYAFIIDWHIRVLLALAWLVAASLLWSLVGGGTWPQSWFQHTETRPVCISYAVFLPAALLYFLYHPVLEILMSGRTPGKRMAGVRVVANDGHSASAGALLIRNVFRLIDVLPSLYILGLAVALFHPRQLRIGDIAAGTLLVFEERPRAQTLERIATLAANGVLTPATLDVLEDLLVRWSQLERAQRIQLAEHFLQRVGVTVPETTSWSGRERHLLAALKHVAGA
jgi:uncharacterized RDD family membrane protein YckC